MWRYHSLVSPFGDTLFAATLRSGIIGRQSKFLALGCRSGQEKSACSTRFQARDGIAPGCENDTSTVGQLWGQAEKSNRRKSSAHNTLQSGCEGRRLHHFKTQRHPRKHKNPAQMRGFCYLAYPIMSRAIGSCPTRTGESGSSFIRSILHGLQPPAN